MGLVTRLKRLVPRKAASKVGIVTLSVLVVMIFYRRADSPLRLMTKYYKISNTIWRGDVAVSRDKKDREIYYRRSAVALAACPKSGPGHIKQVLTDKGGRLANCIIPKVGCTYWISIFRYLNNYTDGHVYSSPLDMPRRVVHYAPLGNKYENITVAENPIVSKTLRFMFVRDPYSRLFSAWVDKVHLPDFWFTQALIVKNYLTRPHKNRVCAKDISFVDFLRFTVNQVPSKLNEHWIPYKYLCDPCLFRPRVIGKIETFGQDVRFILDSVNLTWILNLPRNSSRIGGQKSNHTDRSLGEMRMITAAAFDIVDRFSGMMKKCSTLIEVCQRLWAAFQYNGHLPASKPFPQHRFKDKPPKPDEFLRVAEETYHAWEGRTRAVQSNQKWQAVIDAYKHVPPQIMAKIQEIYKFDFEFYEYPKKPKYLYEHIK